MPPLNRDGGSPDPDAGQIVSGSVEVRLEVQEMGDVFLDEGSMQVATVRARSDRGESDEPRWDNVGRWEFGRDDALRTSGLPATYGGVLIEFEEGQCEVLLRVSSRDAREVEICLSRLRPLDLRCESPAELVAGAGVRVRARLRLHRLEDALRDADLESGERIDADSDAELHDELVSAWGDAWSVDCTPRDMREGP